MTPKQIADMHEANNAYREAIDAVITAAKPTSQQRDHVQAMGMAFHHHVRLHTPYIMERLAELIGPEVL
jgi:hypothetical protein